MALSQLLDDSPLRGDPRPAGAEGPYNEGHRLALEQLLSGGPGCFLDFLRKEELPNFLSDHEIRQIRAAAVPLRGEDAGLERSLGGSLDCSSLTYFPEVSDLEPPLLELGWPAFTAGSYRGVTRAVAHFQPGYGGCIYGCKEAARRMIKSAREVPKNDALYGFKPVSEQNWVISLEDGPLAAVLLLFTRFIKGSGPCVKTVTIYYFISPYFHHNIAKKPNNDSLILNILWINMCLKLGQVLDPVFGGILSRNNNLIQLHAFDLYLDCLFQTFFHIRNVKFSKELEDIKICARSTVCGPRGISWISERSTRGIV